MKTYDTILFDCDGVILNSNQIKSQAFYDVASAYSIPAARELVEYNQQFGGISRHEKFKYFVNAILPKYSDIKHSEEDLITEFAKHVKQGLVHVWNKVLNSVGTLLMHVWDRYGTVWNTGACWYMF